jgi:hypothetical protein
MVFSFSQKAFSADDLADLHGKVVIITGAKCVYRSLTRIFESLFTCSGWACSSGVGYGTTQWLARKGAKVRRITNCPATAHQRPLC